MKRSTSLLAVISAIALLTAACSSGSSSASKAPSPTAISSGGGTSSAKQVSIGVCEPLSGSLASSGVDTLHGIELATSIINGKYPGVSLPLAADAGLSGLGGAQVKIISTDDQSNPQVATSNVRQLVTENNVSSVIGCWASAQTAAASALTERLQVPFVTGVSSAVDLTNQGLKWFFRTGPTDQTLADSLFAVIHKVNSTHKVSKIAIIHVNNTFGNGADKVSKAEAQKAGYDVVADIGYNATVSDLTSEVLKLRSANPDVVLDASYAPDAILLIRTMKNLDYYPAAFLGFGAGLADPSFLPSVGAAGDGVTSRFGWAVAGSGNKQAGQAVASMFQKKYGRAMDENSGRGFIAMMTLAQAINNAKSSEPSAIRDALVKIDIPAKDSISSGGVKFDENHQNTEAAGVVEQVVNGKWVSVYPDAVATQQLVVPMTAAR